MKPKPKTRKETPDETQALDRPNHPPYDNLRLLCSADEAPVVLAAARYFDVLPSQVTREQKSFVRRAQKSEPEPEPATDRAEQEQEQEAWEDAELVPDMTESGRRWFLGQRRERKRAK